MAPKTSSGAPKGTSIAARCKVEFPYGRTERLMRKRMPGMRVSRGAPMAMAAVLAYVAAEVAELASNSAKSHKRVVIGPRDIYLAIQHDPELGKLYQSCEIYKSGGLVKIDEGIINSLKQRHERRQKSLQRAARRRRTANRAEAQAPAAAAPAAPRVLKAPPKKAARGVPPVADPPADSPANSDDDI